MGQLSLVLCDLAGNALPQEWAIEDVLSATVMMEELDRFSPHSITVTGSFRRNLALLNGLASVQIFDANVGMIAWGMLNDPEEQITHADAHTITLSLPNITEVLRYSTTGQGWVAGDASLTLGLQSIVNRLGALHKGWSASCLDFGTEPFILAFDDATVLGALTDTATATFSHIRQGRDARGQPNRTMELLRQGAAPSIELISPDGANANDIVARNPNARLVDSIIRHPADCTKLVNAMTPLGAGTGNQQVRFRRLFKIITDPTYEHFGFAQYFPEFDPAFPIGAIPSGGRFVPGRPMKGDSTQMEIAARLDGGADGYEYHILHTASLAHYNALYPGEGEFRSQFSDSTFAYPTDATDITSQEKTERALYVAAKAQLQWYGFPQRTITVTTVGTARPPRAGDTATITYRRIGVDGQGQFQEFDEEGTVYTIVSVQRTYDAMGVATDTWTLTNNGKQPPDATGNEVDTTRKLIEAIRSVPTTVAAPYPIESGIWDVDAVHPLTLLWEIPTEAFRVQSAKIRVNVFPSRANVRATDAPPLTVTVPIPALNVVAFPLPLHAHSSPIPTHAHGGINTTLGVSGSTDISHAQGTSTPATKSGTSDNASSLPGDGNHAHNLPIFGSSGLDPTGEQQNVWVKDGRFLAMAAGAQPQIPTGSQTINSNHGHADTIGVGGGGNVNNLGFTSKGLGSGAAPIAFNTSPFGTVVATNADNGGVVIGATTQGTTEGVTATHSHNLVPGIFETTLPVKYGLSIDPGDGTFVDRSGELGGPWSAGMTTSVFISQFLTATTAGQVVRFQVVPLTDASNPTGLFRAEINGYGVLEMSSAASTFFGV